MHSRAEIVNMFRSFLESCGPTQHLLGNLTIESDGTTADSRCYVRDLHLGQDGDSRNYFSTSGEYRDRWRQTSEGWRIVHRKKLLFLTQGSSSIFQPKRS